MGGWHAEWPLLADALQTTGSGLDAACRVVEGLTVDTARMRANLDATRGSVTSEWLAMLAGRVVGRDEARLLARRLLARVSDHVSLAMAVHEIPELRDSLSADELRVLQDPSAYLGQAEQFRRRLLEDD